MYLYAIKYKAKLFLYKILIKENEIFYNNLFLFLFVDIHLSAIFFKIISIRSLCRQLFVHYSSVSIHEGVHEYSQSILIEKV